jgi:hypothetical protein
MKPAHRIVLLLASLIWTACVAPASEPEKNSEVTVTLYDSNGLSSGSAKDHVLEIILYKPHTHIHLKISNTTDQAITLWRPYCPQGDAAMNIEFRETAVPDKIFRAFTGANYAYMAGSGFPKAFTLAPGNDLIVNVDFLNEWSLPFSMKVGETREFEMRAVYRSAPLTEERMEHFRKEMEGSFGSKELAEHVFGLKEIERVWSGVATSDWQKARVINHTGAAVEAKY